MLASKYGHLEIVKTLLAANAVVNQADNIGHTPLFEALSNSHSEVAAVLLAAGAH